MVSISDTRRYKAMSPGIKIVFLLSFCLYGWWIAFISILLERWLVTFTGEEEDTVEK